MTKKNRSPNTAPITGRGFSGLCGAGSSTNMEPTKRSGEGSVLASIAKDQIPPLEGSLKKKGQKGDGK
ncbi:hypothetical protein Ddc_02238 [Ditylenchus destructor]|nr:hypothetical protein Ddc_02238 [Ditylenchus destructor]